MTPTEVGAAAGELLRVATAAGELSATERARLRASVVEAAVKRPRRTWVWAAPAAAAAAACVAVLLLLVTSSPGRGGVAEGALAFSIGEPGNEGTLGAYYSAKGAEKLPLQFSDGSTVVLESGASARISTLNERGAGVLVEAGVAEVMIEPRPGAQWVFVAGPYSIRVTGTAFRLSWAPKEQALELWMRSGSVLVRGPGLEQGVRVKGTERFFTQAPFRVEEEGMPEGAMSPQQAAPSPQGIAPDQAPEPSSAPRADERQPSARAASVRGHAPPQARAEGPQHASTNDRKTWSTLTGEGKHEQVIALAEERGLGQVLGGASSEDLLALADAARFRGRSALAKDALLALRSRFSGTRATTAAFLLGRLEEDTGALREAHRWYEEYGRRAPSGPLAAEALGRRMLVERRLGWKEASKASAEEYVRRFPSGAYRELAAGLLGAR